MVHIETLNWLREEGSACLGGISAMHGVDFSTSALQQALEVDIQHHSADYIIILWLIMLSWE